MEQVNDIINNLCEKLGTTVETIVPEYAKMRITECLAQVIICGVVLAIALICLFYVLKLYKKFDKENEYPEEDIFNIASVVISFIAAFSFIAFILLLIFDIPTILKYYNAPYGAFVEEMIGGIK